MRRTIICAPSPPPAPDYAAAAQAQGAANVDAARTQGRINNPNVVSPQGTQTVTWEGDTPTLTQNLSPQEQAIYNTNAQLRQSLGGLGLQGAGSLGQVIGQNLDLSGLPPQAQGSDAQRKAVIAAMMSRSNEDINNQQDDARSALIAAGIRPGTEAYDRETQRFDRQRVDARNQAELSAGSEAQRSFGMDTEARKNALAELLTGRQTPLNEITALMSGSQVSNPFSTPGYAQNSTVAPAPVFAGAQAQGQYDMNVANNQTSTLNGLLGAGAKLGSAFMMMPSDVRWKSNIERIGTHPAGMGWYEYDIDGVRTQGVMAQEARLYCPQAVLERPDGFLMVNYRALEAA